MGGIGRNCLELSAAPTPSRTGPQARDWRPPPARRLPCCARPSRPRRLRL